MVGSLFNAIVSGRAGVALLTDGPAVYSLEPQSNEPVARQPEEFYLLFGESRDFEFIEDAACDEIADCLTAAMRREQALDLALMLLEPDYDLDIRREAAEELDESLHDESVVQSLDSIMYSTPLPRGTDVPGAESVVPPNCHDAARWLERLRQLQTTIRLVHDAWASLPDDVLPSPDRNDAEAACVRAYPEAVVVQQGEMDGPPIATHRIATVQRSAEQHVLRPDKDRWPFRVTLPLVFDRPAGRCVLRAFLHG
jgi:hypothetical protein